MDPVKSGPRKSPQQSCMHMYMYMYMNMYTYVYIYIYVCVYVYVYVMTWTWTCICICICICVWVYACIYAYVYIHNMHIHLHSYVYIDTMLTMSAQRKKVPAGMRMRTISSILLSQVLFWSFRDLVVIWKKYGVVVCPKITLESQWTQWLETCQTSLFTIKIAI